MLLPTACAGSIASVDNCMTHGGMWHMLQGCLQRLLTQRIAHAWLQLGDRPPCTNGCSAKQSVSMKPCIPGLSTHHNCTPRSGAHILSAS